MNNLTKEMLNSLAIEGPSGKNYLDKYKIWSEAKCPDAILPFLPSIPGWYYCKGKESKPNGLAQGKEYIVEVYLSGPSLYRFRTWNLDGPVDYSVEWLGPVKPFFAEPAAEEISAKTTVQISDTPKILEENTENSLRVGDIYESLGLRLVVLGIRNSDVLVFWENKEEEYLVTEDLASPDFKYITNISLSKNPTDFQLSVGSIIKKNKNTYLLKRKISRDMYETLQIITTEDDLIFDDATMHLPPDTHILGHFHLEEN